MFNLKIILIEGTYLTVSMDFNSIRCQCMHKFKYLCFTNLNLLEITNPTFFVMTFYKNSV